MISASGFYWSNVKGLQLSNLSRVVEEPDIVFYFVDKKVSKNVDAYGILKEKFPKSALFGCSSSGPILNDDLYADTFTGVAIAFEKTKIKVAQKECPDQTQSYEAGKEIIQELLANDLKHIFVITDGMTVHGTEFINGANSLLPDGVNITGGMSSDGFEFKETLTGVNGPMKSGQVCAVGFYGDALEVGFGAEGGWDKFGLERIVTKSQGNVLYELDGIPALDIYKEYLGEEAKNLPGSGLLFPLSVRKDKNSDAIVRTIDIVDEEKKALRFSGDIPQGYIAQFMKGDFTNLVSGASNAAAMAKSQIQKAEDGVALVVSCLGRQLLMGQQVCDELEAVTTSLGDKIPAAGFYSNGEYSYSSGKKNTFCVLHNQTMTLTVLRETDG